jgi:hypothetical protein
LPVLGCPTTDTEDDSIKERPSHAQLLTGIEIRAEVVRSRSERKSVQSVGTFNTKTAWSA